MAFLKTAAIILATTTTLALAQDPPKPDFPDPWNVPAQSEPGQSGTNQCGAGSDQNSNCQTMFINSIDDFCLWAPPQPDSEVAATEEVEVAWCTAPGRGTRVIPQGALTGVHYVATPLYVQITGTINGPLLNIQRGDAGGELDPHGASGNGNPIGSLVYTTAFGNGVQQVKEWMSFMGDGEFCFRICNPANPTAPRQCAHEYDTMGCEWVMPGNYAEGSFDACMGDSLAPPGVDGGNTFHQGQANTPAAHDPAPTSQCQTFPTIAPALVNIPNAPYNSALSASSAASAASLASISAASAASVASVSAASASQAAQASSASAAAAAAASQSRVNVNSPTSTGGSTTKSTTSSSAAGPALVPVAAAGMAVVIVGAVFGVIMA